MIKYIARYYWGDDTLNPLNYSLLIQETLTTAGLTAASR
eukprot:SAG22_NODE_7_length_40155_cov_25.241356_39_plen_39_part_00